MGPDASPSTWWSLVREFRDRLSASPAAASWKAPKTAGLVGGAAKSRPEGAPVSAGHRRHSMPQPARVESRMLADQKRVRAMSPMRKKTTSAANCPQGIRSMPKADLRLLDSVLGHIAALPMADHPAGVRLDTGSRPESRQTLARNGFHALPIAAPGRRPQLTAAAEKGHTQRSVIGRSGSLRTCGDEPNADGRGERRRPRPHDHFFAGGKARR